MNTSRNNVLKVYSGKARSCMCGCFGNWSYTSGAKADCGYEPTRNDRVVSRIYNKVMSDPSRQVDNDAGCVYVDTPRMMAVYFTPAQ